MEKHKKGFTLIELLVVITIIAALAGIVLTNFLGVRERAKDSKKKAELNQIKSALRLYYNDFQKYPGGTLGVSFKGCGPNGDVECPGLSQPPGAGVCLTAEFASGGLDGCGSIYMKKFPDFNGATTGMTFNYYQYSSGDDYRIKVDLDNLSDPELVASQSRCPKSSGTWATREYVLCAD